MSEMNEKSYCFLTKEGKYIAVDRSNGGYPYETCNPLETYIFSSIEDAKRYANLFKDSMFTSSENWVLKKFLGILVDDI